VDSLQAAQRRPGPKPQRHGPQGERGPAGSASRSTKAGAETPATPSPGCSRREATSTLNEGRGRNPSDTPDHVHQGALDAPRSTKAGAETPATPVESLERRLACLGCAQRRPGPKPQRHLLLPSRFLLEAGHAQRRPGPKPQRHDDHGFASTGGELRSTKAGAETPATPTGLGGAGVTEARSTKAGAETPATHDGSLRAVRPDYRSTKAGAETPATRHQSAYA